MPIHQNESSAMPLYNRSQTKLFSVIFIAILLLSGMLSPNLQTASGRDMAAIVDTVFVEPDDYPDEIGALNRAIEENGGEVVYVLQNGATYFWEGNIQYDHPIRIHAAEYPSENPPIIRTIAGSTISPRMPNFLDDVEIVGVYLYAISNNSSRGAGMIFHKEGGRVVFRHCYVSGGYHFLFSLQGANMTLRIEDTQMRDPGQAYFPANNSVIDVGRHGVDSIIVVNSSMYQVPFHIIRNRDRINYFEFNHVTVTNHLRTRPVQFVNLGNPLDLGTMREAIIRNSLFVNTGTEGVWESREVAGEAGHAYNGERYFDSRGLITAQSYEEHPDHAGGGDEQRRIVIRNNNFGGMPDSVFVELWKKMSQDDPDREFLQGTRPWGTDPQWRWENPGVEPGDSAWAQRDTIPLIRIRTAPMDSLLRAWAQEEVPWVDIGNNIEEQVAFTDPPDFWRMADYGHNLWFMIGYTRSYYDRWDSIGADPTNRYFHPGPGTPAEPAGPSAAWWRDLSYSSETQSYYHAENGYPAGNLNYFPELREQWEQGVVRDVPTGASDTDPSGSRPQTIALLGNYPNPFNPVTQVRFELPETAQVRLDVYDVLGRRVATLVNEQVPSGEHRVSFDAMGLSSGLYIARMQAGAEVRTLRMMLVK